MKDMGMGQCENTLATSNRSDRQSGTVLRFQGGDHELVLAPSAELRQNAAEWFDLVIEHNSAAAMALACGDSELAESELRQGEACSARARASLAEARTGEPS